VPRQVPGEVVMDQQEYTPAQLQRIGVVYDALARLLPTEGRDYNVVFSFDKKSPESISVAFKPHTELGKLWCDYCTRAFKGAKK